MALYRSSLDQHTTQNELMCNTAVADDPRRVVVPSHDYLRFRIMFECHDAPTGSQCGHEKTYLWFVVMFTSLASINLFAKTYVLVRSAVR